jgi:hypothetical protein
MTEICAIYLVGVILASILLLVASAIRETSTVKTLGCPTTIFFVAVVSNLSALSEPHQASKTKKRYRKQEQLMRDLPSRRCAAG